MSQVTKGQVVISMIMLASLAGPVYVFRGRLYAYLNQNQQGAINPAINPTDKNVTQGWLF